MELDPRQIAYSAHRAAMREAFLHWRDTRELPGSPDTRLEVEPDTAPALAVDVAFLGTIP